MNMPQASFLAWQKQFTTEDDCLKYLQEYLDELCYRLNRRFIEKQLPNRLLNLAIVYVPVK